MLTVLKGKRAGIEEKDETCTRDPHRDFSAQRTVAQKMRFKKRRQDKF